MITIESPAQLVLFAMLLGTDGVRLTVCLMEAYQREALRQAFESDPTTQDERNNPE